MILFGHNSVFNRGSFGTSAFRFDNKPYGPLSPVQFQRPRKRELLALNCGDNDCWRIWSDFEKVAPGIQLITKSGLRLLYSCVLDENIPDDLNEIKLSTELMCNRLSELSPYEALFLLKNCQYIPKLLYKLRSVPFFQYEDRLKQCDDMCNSRIQVGQTKMPPTNPINISRRLSRGSQFAAGSGSVEQTLSNKTEVPEHLEKQRPWDISLAERVHNSLKDSLSMLDRMRLTAVSCKELLNALPDASLGTR
ncbi:hypothetical protein ACOME3_007279 [Neoechinorhynchus agilis]